jgi:hypothetical protein
MPLLTGGSPFALPQMSIVPAATRTQMIRRILARFAAHPARNESAYAAMLACSGVILPIARICGAVFLLALTSSVGY